MTARIVIIGGGAGGLELACKLGRKLGPEQVTLIDANLFHIWKPSLHEVAAGTLDIHQEGLSYSMLAYNNRFNFVYGAMSALDAAGRTVTVSETLAEDGSQVLPRRQIEYDQLVLAIGSTANYFGVPGAEEHTLSLNGPHDAEQFRMRMLKLLTLADLQKPLNPQAGIDIVIIGGGATGVELAAELRESSLIQARYSYRHLEPAHDIRITLLEGAPRILAPLPERVSSSALHLLAQRHIGVHTECRVTQIAPDRVIDSEGNIYPADMIVWAAGIKAPPVLASLGLPTNRSGQVEVDEKLHVVDHPGLFALGDCAACPMPQGGLVPPRAQSAHQQADYLYTAFMAAARNKPAPDKGYRYRDYGSLVSLGTQTSVGNLMGNLFNASWFVEGLFARCMYVSLHLLHHRSVLGTLRTGVLAVARYLVKRARPQVKLH